MVHHPGGALNKRSGEKRDAIIEAAIVEIANRGFHNTSVSRIARRAGVADGTIYLYFQNKEDILVSIFDNAMEGFIHTGRRELASTDGCRAKLSRIIRLHLESLGENHDLAVIFQVELRHSLHFLSVFSRSSLRDYLQTIAEVIGEGQAQGEFRGGLDPMACAKAVFGILDQTATDWILADANSRLSARAELVEALVLGGIQT
jgi:TetR/AcrR family transcriptional regulator, fatty acid metabolism regulator protein